MGTEKDFEYLAFAREVTRGTAVTPPTHYVPLNGTLLPSQELYVPNESRGILAAEVRSKTADRRAALEAEGGLDADFGPFWAQMLLNGGVTSPSTPGGATLTRLWEFVRTMTSDNLKSATAYFGDPNVQIWQTPYLMLTEATIASNVPGNTGVTLTLAGMGQFPAKVAAPALPAQLVGDLLMPADKQVWLDTSSAIGTTEITSRVVSVEQTLRSGIVFKKTASGPTGARTWTRIGRQKVSPETVIELEVDNSTDYDIWAANTEVKLRVRYNGALIEGAFYNYVEIDMYGILSSLEYGENEGTNRTHKFGLTGRYNATLGSDLRVAFQNQKATV